MVKTKQEIKEIKADNVSLVVSYTMRYISETEKYISDIERVYLNIGGILTDITDSIKSEKLIFDLLDYNM